MQRDFRLLTCGCLSCRYYSRGLGVGRYGAGADSKGFVEIRTWNNRPERSGRGADDGDASASLSAQTHGHFGLGAPRCRSEESRVRKNVIHTMLL